jgi:hypothetical protein
MGFDADLPFSLVRNAVLRRSTFDYTGDKKVLPFKVGGFQNLIQNSARTPHKWLALYVLFPSRGFPQQHDSGSLRTVTRHSLLTTLMEITPGTDKDFPGDCPQPHLHETNLFLTRLFGNTLFTELSNISKLHTFLPLVRDCTQCGRVGEAATVRHGPLLADTKEYDI